MPYSVREDSSWDRNFILPSVHVLLHIYYTLPSYVFFAECRLCCLLDIQCVLRYPSHGIVCCTTYAILYSVCFKQPRRATHFRCVQNMHHTHASALLQSRLWTSLLSMVAWHVARFCACLIVLLAATTVRHVSCDAFAPCQSKVSLTAQCGGQCWGIVATSFMAQCLPTSWSTYLA